MEGNEASVRQSTYIKRPGELPIKIVLPVFLLPVFNFFDRNNKSEPMTNRQKVRIILFWWRLRDSMADFAPWGKIIRMQPVFELAAAICHRHIALKWVRVPCLQEEQKTPSERMVFSVPGGDYGTRTCDLMRVKHAL